MAAAENTTRCARCCEEIESILINGIETERVMYKCGNEHYWMHMGCILNHHSEGQYCPEDPSPKECYVCRGNNPDHNKEDVKATFEHVLMLHKMRLWKKLTW